MSDDERGKLVHNESTKLSATYLNGVAIATFAVGALTIPLNSAAQGNPSIAVIAIALVCTGASAGLHSLARSLLRGLK